MKNTEWFPDTQCLLRHLGYHENFIPLIMEEIENLFIEIDFEAIENAAASAMREKDTIAFVNIMKDLMKRLEDKGYYRPDYPTRLIRFLVNGLNIKCEDIFHILAHSDISENEKRNEMEFLASCAAITQLGYIMLSRFTPGVLAASSGPHVFLVIDNARSLILIDFSIDSIMEIDALQYEKDEDHYVLRSHLTGLDEETIYLLKQYYSDFHVTSGFGLSHNIHNNIGLAYDRIGRFDDAIEELNNALKLDPDYVEVRNNLAVTFDKMKLFDKAVNHLKEAIRQRPDYTEAHCNLGTIYGKQGNYDDAIAELNTALRLNPRFAVARNNLGNIYAMSERNDEAAREFKEALNIDPNYPRARSNLGNIYSVMGKHEEALVEFQEALKIDPEFADAYQGIGQAYYDLGSLDRASQAFIRAVCLEPELFKCVPDKLALKVRQGFSRLSGRI